VEPESGGKRPEIRLQRFDRTFQNPGGHTAPSGVHEGDGPPGFVHEEERNAVRDGNAQKDPGHVRHMGVEAFDKE